MRFTLPKRHSQKHTQWFYSEMPDMGNGCARYRHLFIHLTRFPSRGPQCWITAEFAYRSFKVRDINS